MKKRIKYLLLPFFVLGSILWGQTFNVSVQNQTVIGTEFHFEIYLLRTADTDIYLGDCKFVIEFNGTNFFPRQCQVVSEGLTGWYSFSPSIGIIKGFTGPNKYFLLLDIQKPTFNDQTEFDSRIQVISNAGHGSKIAHVKITSILNPSGTAGLQWEATLLYPKLVTTLQNSEPWSQINITSNGIYINPSDHSLPVQMYCMNAECTIEGILLTWETASEVNSHGFHIWRSNDPEGEFERITTSLIPSTGNNSSGGKYHFTDNHVENNKTYYYKIQQLDSDGTNEMFQAVKVMAAYMPTEFAMSQNYPNPFNPKTTIAYDILEASNVTIKIYSLLGREVYTLCDKNQTPGHYVEIWDGRDESGHEVPSGVYFYRLHAGEFQQARKMMLVR